MPLRRLLLLCAAALPAAAETLDPIDDLRLGLSVIAAPEITEVVTDDATGAKTDYDWRGTTSAGPRIDLTYVRGWERGGRAHGGLLWGVGIAYSDIDITPSRYYVNGAPAGTNTRPDLEVHLKQYGGLLAVGWGTTPIDTDLGDLHFELLPTLRGGLLSAETVSPGTLPRVRDGRAWWWEAGATLGVVLCEDHWVGGLRAGWMYGRNTVKIGLPGSLSSELTLTRNGPEVGLDFGYRF